MFCASIIYPTGLDRFDADYFGARHIPMFVSLLGANCARYEVHRPLTQPGAPDPPFAAAAYVWVRSAEEFGAVLAEHGAEIYADIERFSSGQPIRAWSLVVQASPEDTGT
jgi:uncharacterized protein (TIGR02118 family)